MTLIEAISEEQKTIICRGVSSGKISEESIADIDLIADLAELKILLRRSQK